jgi:hypothetical protein
VSTGDFSPLAPLFRSDARLVFLGTSLGPFEGREAILEAFRKWPPSSELREVSVTDAGEQTTRAEFESSDASRGRLTLTERDGRIEKLVIDLR